MYILYYFNNNKVIISTLWTRQWERRNGFLSTVLKSTLEDTAAGDAEMRQNPLACDRIHWYATKSTGMRQTLPMWAKNERSRTAGGVSADAAALPRTLRYTGGRSRYREGCFSSVSFPCRPPDCAGYNWYINIDTRCISRCEMLTRKHGVLKYLPSVNYDTKSRKKRLIPVINTTSRAYERVRPGKHYHYAYFYRQAVM